MGKMETLQPIPPAAILRVLATFDRDQLAGFIAVAIDLLDFADGDTDLEETDTEDAFALSWIARGYDTGPGCVISDIDKGVDDGGEDDDEREARDFYFKRPVYGEDQTMGPVNQIEIARDHHRRLMEDPNYS